MPTCIEWGVERHQECNSWADQGYRDCCDWWPCSWLCDAWVWISNVVCVGWTWVSTAVCVVWDVVTTVVNAVLVVLEATLGWVLSALASIIELVLAIPVLGTLLRWLLNGITHIVWIILSLPDVVAGVIGIRPEKLLRVCTIIQLDENGAQVAPVSDAVTLLQLACDVYKRDANVRIIPSREFKFTTGFLGPEQADASWVVVENTESSALTLDTECNAAGAGAEWLLVGSAFQLKMRANCLFGAWRRVLGYGAPVACFFVRDAGKDAVGCALWITDYATMENLTTATLRVLAHEVGHASNLWHICVDDDNRNLMATTRACDPDSSTAPDTSNPRMDWFQVQLVRASKHCTYF